MISSSILDTSFNIDQLTEAFELHNFELGTLDMSLLTAILGKNESNEPSSQISSPLAVLTAFSVVENPTDIEEEYADEEEMSIEETPAAIGIRSGKRPRSEMVCKKLSKTLST